MSSILPIPPSDMQRKDQNQKEKIWDFIIILMAAGWQYSSQQTLGLLAVYLCIMTV